MPLLLYDGTRKYVWGLGEVYNVDKTTGAARVYHTDGLGSVRAITDTTSPNALVIQTYRTMSSAMGSRVKGTPIPTVLGSFPQTVSALALALPGGRAEGDTTRLCDEQHDLFPSLHNREA